MHNIYLESQPGPSRRYSNGGRVSSVSSYTLVDQVETISNSHLGDPAKKKRKIDRACDNCRQKRCRCDGPQQADGVCTNCRELSKPCTYVAGSKPRGPPKAYVTGLEDKLERLEAILRNIRPNIDFSSEIGPPIVRGSWRTPQTRPSSNPHKSHVKEQEYSPILSNQALAHSDHSSPSSLSSFPPYPLEPPSLAHVASFVSLSNLSPQAPTFSPQHSGRTKDSGSDYGSEDPSSSETEEVQILSIDGHEGRLKLRSLESPEVDSQMRFHGKSSTMRMIEATRLLREERMNEGEETAGSSAESRRRSTETPVHRRPEFWTTPVWELEWEGLSTSQASTQLLASTLSGFPPPELAAQLVDLYFAHYNTFFPLLHRPTFERQWNKGKHEKDPWFTCLCLSIFAVASRWSTDPRVCGTTQKSPPDWTRAGWFYLGKCMEIHRARRSIIQPTCLFELQSYSLVSMFFRGSVWSPVAWVIVSIGIRKAQDVGAHRQKVYNHQPTVEDELWKRAFFLLVFLDRVGSIQLGRSCSIGEEDFDLELPLEVDDEYFEPENPAEAFVQPSGKPSVITGFVLLLKLTQIAAFALRTIYAIDKSKVHFGGSASQWKEEVVGQLNTAMGAWVESIPPHLQWNEDMPFAKVFADQAALNYTTYYLVQIMVFRPFIVIPEDGLQPRTPSEEFPYASIEICIKATRTCARIVATLVSPDMENVAGLLGCAHICAAFMSMQVWRLKAKAKVENDRTVKAAIKKEIESLMGDIDVFMKLLTLHAPRWEAADFVLKALREYLPPLDEVVEEVDDHFAQYEHAASFQNPPTFPPLPETLSPLPVETRPWPWYNEAEPHVDVPSAPQQPQSWGGRYGARDDGIPSRPPPSQYTVQELRLPAIDTRQPTIHRMTSGEGHRQQYTVQEQMQPYHAEPYTVQRSPVDLHRHQQQQHADVRSTMGTGDFRPAYRERPQDENWSHQWKQPPPQHQSRYTIPQCSPQSGQHGHSFYQQ